MRGRRKSMEEDGEKYFVSDLDPSMKSDKERMLLE